MGMVAQVAADFHFHFTAKRRLLHDISVITSGSAPLFRHVLGQECHLFEAVHVAEHRTDGDRYDILQFVATRLARAARIFDLAT